MNHNNLNYEQSIKYKNEIIKRLKNLKPGPNAKNNRQIINGVIERIDSISELYVKQIKQYKKSNLPEKEYKFQIDSFVKEIETFYEQTRKYTLPKEN